MRREPGVREGRKQGEWMGSKWLHGNELAGWHEVAIRMLFG
jgi:hypothetical protein